MIYFVRFELASPAFRKRARSVGEIQNQIATHLGEGRPPGFNGSMNLEIYLDRSRVWRGHFLTTPVLYNDPVMAQSQISRRLRGEAARSRIVALVSQERFGSRRALGRRV